MNLAELRAAQDARKESIRSRFAGPEEVHEVTDVDLEERRWSNPGPVDNSETEEAAE